MLGLIKCVLQQMCLFNTNVKHVVQPVHSVKRHMQTLYYRCTGMLVHCIMFVV